MMFFVLADAQAKVVINEVMFDPDGTDGNSEWVELYNSGAEDVHLDGWDLDSDSGSYIDLVGRTIEGGKFLIIEGVSKMRNDKGQVSLYDSHSHTAGTIVDYVQYGAEDLGTAENKVRDRAIEAEIWNGGDFVQDIAEGKTVGRMPDGTDTDSAGDWKVFTGGGTPNAANMEEDPEPEPAPEPKIYSKNIEISELLPDPSDGGEEYIELYNSGEDEVNLGNWSLHDASKSGEYIFSQADSIGPKKYLAVYKGTYKFALNNSGRESVTLYDPDKKEVFQVEYVGSKQGVSYDFNGLDWHWSRFLTPGEENVFEKVPAGKLDVDKETYVNVYGDFEILGLSKKAKVVWDFGDGHKSYLRKTRHRYVQVGKYSASVKFSEGSEDVISNFTVEVAEVPHPKVKITAVNANPKGSDAELETLTILNKSKKKIDLSGWSIATGWKKMYNHPIIGDFVIKAGKEKEITREFSRFTLNNEKTKIELRYPDGKVAYEMKYKKKGGIEEGETYIRGRNGWKWEVENKEPEAFIQKPKTATQEIGASEQETAAIPAAADLPKQPFLRNRIVWLDARPVANIELADARLRAFGIGSVQEIGGTYRFTPQYPEPRHYAVIFLENIFFRLNQKANLLLNYFLN